jgi:hypothetical protein
VRGMGEYTCDLRKYRRQSEQAIRVYTAIFVILTVLLWLAGRFVTVPVWLSATALGVTAFTLVVDLINVAYCGWRLHRRDFAEPDATLWRRSSNRP